MNRFPFILADEDIGKLVGFLVIAAIWIIGQFGGSGLTLQAATGLPAILAQRLYEGY